MASVGDSWTAILWFNLLLSNKLVSWPLKRVSKADILSSSPLSIYYDEGFTLETYGFETLQGGQVMNSVDRQRNA